MASSKIKLGNSGLFRIPLLSTDAGLTDFVTAVCILEGAGFGIAEFIPGGGTMFDAITNKVGMLFVRESTESFYHHATFMYVADTKMWIGRFLLSSGTLSIEYHKEVQVQS